MIRTLTLSALALLALPLLQGCCCCCSGCPGPSSSSSTWDDDWGDDLGEMIAEEAIEGLSGAEIDVDEDGGTISLETPEGTMNLSGGPGSTYPEGLPVEQYPGSSVEGGMDFGGGGDSMVTTILKSSDSIDDISTWYEGKLGSDVQRMDMTQDGQRVVTLTKMLDDNRSVVVAVGEDAGSRVITITAASGAAP